MNQVLLEMIMCMEKEIVQEEWEMAIVDYAGNKCNFTSEITDLEKELTDCHTKIESLLEQQAQFEQQPPFVSNRLLMLIMFVFTLDCPMP